MKIVHCFYSMEVGGAEVLTIDLLNEMCKEHDCALVVVNNRKSEALLKELDKRVAVYCLNRTVGSLNPLPIIKFNLLLKKLRPDIIHHHDENLTKIQLLSHFKKWAGPGLVYTIHALNIPTVTYKYYDRLAAISQCVYKDTITRYNGNVTVVNNGVNSASFNKRTVYDLQDGVIKIIQVGRLVHEIKGNDVLLKALALLKKKINITQVKLDFAGSGPSEAYLRNLVNELELETQVNFLGDKGRPWLHGQLSQYHLLVQPSRVEGLGLTVLEGFAAGLPVLASDSDGPAEIIKQTERGWLFEKGNVEDCAEKLHHIITDYTSGAMQWLMNTTVAIADTKYSAKTCANGYLDLYQQLLAKN